MRGQFAPPQLRASPRRLARLPGLAIPRSIDRASIAARIGIVSACPAVAIRSVSRCSRRRTIVSAPMHPAIHSCHAHRSEWSPNSRFSTVEGCGRNFRPRIMRRQRSCRKERSGHDQSEKLGISCHVALSRWDGDDTSRHIAPCISPLIWINRSQLRRPLPE
jgi:hypothetical protein